MPKLSPRSRSASTMVSLAAASPAPTYPGFEVGQYPGDPWMTAFWHGNGTPFYWTGFYLPSEANSYNNTWMDRKTFLAGLGYGFAVLYVGRKTTDLTYDRGGTDGAEAESEALQAGLSDIVIYLDVEAGAGSISPALLSYIDGWLDHIDNSDSQFFPGVYFSYSQNADLIKNSRPSMSIRFSVWRLGIIGCTTDIDGHSVADCGVSYASSWQYAQHAQHKPPQPICNQTWNGKTLGVDLDISIYQNPSAPLNQKKGALRGSGSADPLPFASSSCA